MFNVLLLTAFLPYSTSLLASHPSATTRPSSFALLRSTLRCVLRRIPQSVDYRHARLRAGPHLSNPGSTFLYLLLSLRLACLIPFKSSARPSIYTSCLTTCFREELRHSLYIYTSAAQARLSLTSARHICKKVIGHLLHFHRGCFQLESSRRPTRYTPNSQGCLGTVLSQQDLNDDYRKTT